MPVTTKKKRPRLTPEERERRKHQRSADRKNAKLSAEHPLFVDHLKAEGAFTDAEKEYWHWRRNKANAAGVFEVAGPAVEGLRWIDVQAAERIIGRIAGSELDGIRAYARRTYPNPSTIMCVYRGMVTRGQQMEFGYRVEERPELITRYNPTGMKLIPTGTFPGDGFVPPMTDAEWDAMFRTPEPAEAPDDGELVARYLAAFTRKAVSRG